MTAKTKTLTYQNEINSLSKYCEIIELKKGDTRIAVSPTLQGRVLTSCVNVKEPGFGWINHKLIKSGKNQAHINAYGGEDRFWIGPEAGQFALFFKPGEEFSFENWQTPACIDSEPFLVKQQDNHSIQMTKECELVNYQNQPFSIEINRKIEMLNAEQIGEFVDEADLNGLNCVAFKSLNSISNKANTAWSKQTGLLSIWILGKFNPSSGAWAIIPTKKDAFINQNYFYADLSERLLQTTNYSLLKVDGGLKSKIGIAPQHDENKLGSFDFKTNTLTVVQYKTDKRESFLNSEWDIQEKPYQGDVLNVYNDGPNEDGSILGPYYELETSSSSRELKPSEAIEHIHTTAHFTGDFEELSLLAKQILGVDLKTIKKTVDAG